MACDIFSFLRARNLLEGKYIYFFGDSNIRAIYKDLVWLIEDGHLISNNVLRAKNETSFAGDKRLSDGILHGGRDYKELREYKNHHCHIRFEFITRLYQPNFIDSIKILVTPPHVIVINSCVWDLTRWGADGVQQYKTNLTKTLTFLKSHLPSTKIIWLTTVPPSFKSEGGFLTKEIAFLRNMLPWQVHFANKFASEVALSLKVDLLDLHYHFRFMMNHHTKDGIHWQPNLTRFATNLLLTHIALVFNRRLPGEYDLDKRFLNRCYILNNDNCVLVQKEVPQNTKMSRKAKRRYIQSKKYLKKAKYY